MSIEALSEISGIDTKQGLTNCMDDESLYTSIIGMFADQLIENVPQLTKAYSEQNWDEIGKVSHSIKGASASVGAFEIQKVAATLEHAAKQNDVSVISENIQHFTSLLSATSDVLKQNL